MSPDELLATAERDLLELRRALPDRSLDGREAIDVHARVALAHALRELAVARRTSSGGGGYAHA